MSRVEREDCMRCLSDIFQQDDFQGKQWEIISSILNDKRDTFVTMASVPGKTLCFQFPSVYLDTITIVVTPFISLMQDQVTNNKDVKAHFFGSGQINKKKLEEIVMNYNILYVTPEYITSRQGKTLLDKIKANSHLSMIAFDEAHYISCWGDGFRKAYAKLSNLREWCPSVPFLTCTAIPSEEVRNDIIQNLGLEEPQFFSSRDYSPNVKYIVKEKVKTHWKNIEPYISDQNNSLIVIYCLSKFDAGKVAGAIWQNTTLSNGDCKIYDPERRPDELNQIIDDFNNNKIRIVVSTIAFGMGMNKMCDVRLVIFYKVPLRFEDFFILSGLAGREEKPAQCLLIHHHSDCDTIWAIFRKENNTAEKTDKIWDIFQKYIQTPDCRRNFILSFYGEDISHMTSRPDCCDNCEVKLSPKIKKKKAKEESGKKFTSARSRL